ncbi:Type 1 glutamine amidotransferase-like domain-containing protein [Streptomyces odontomachi]|uniref:Type 1 glutamine amidotransferase-like domain-containing protein n=1 Tax=Streptomyces odontomachi TaxID=2944940 RepID=UPI00210A10A7|nr:Type 1 glutamine amidotransferase-like domain-containing protein [Streptomyces sp. ODS25]
MELLLSSYVLTGVQRPRMLPATTVTGRAGIILNALDQYGATRDYALVREQKTLASWGYRAEELDLRAYFASPDSPDAPGSSESLSSSGAPSSPGSTGPSGPSGSPDALAARLAGLDMVWALGGNVFVLARAMHAAGFHAALQRQSGRAEFVYGGYSAGACVAGPDLQGLGFVDDEEIVPPGYPAAARPVSLGLVPFRIVPHWQSDHPDASAVDAAVAWLGQAGLEHRCLRDGEVVTRDGAVIALP